MSTTAQVLYSSDYQITTQDVLDELALAISLSGCPLHCRGCHSSFTWEPTFGEILTDDKLKALIQKNPHISCVLFYGGEWQLERLLQMIDIVKEHQLKVCVYTGLMLEEVKLTKSRLLDVVDYLKVGRWISEKGGLNKKTTNQRFYKIDHVNGKNVLTDWTNRFYQN